MATQGKPSTAHVYDKADVCIYCQMHKNNVEILNHVCTPQRELESDDENADTAAEMHRVAVLERKVGV